MNKTLFQITDEMYQLIEYGCNAEGEIAQTQEEFNQMYDEIQLELTTKIDNTNGVIKMITSEVEMIDAEIKRLQALKKSAQQRNEWLKNRIDFVIRQQFTDEDGNVDLVELNKYKLKLPHSQISYRKSESVEIIDEDKVPKKYKTVVIEEKPNKTKLKEYLNTLSKRETKYAKIATNVNISIK